MAWDPGGWVGTTQRVPRILLHLWILLLLILFQTVDSIFLLLACLPRKLHVLEARLLRAQVPASLQTPVTNSKKQGHEHECFIVKWVSVNAFTEEIAPCRFYRMIGLFIFQLVLGFFHHVLGL